MSTVPKLISRRKALSLGLQGATALYGMNLLSPSFALGLGGTAPQRGRCIVLLIKLGGQDMVRSMPFLTSIASEFRTARPSLHIQPIDALDVLDNRIGLHSNYAALRPIAEAGRMKVVTACGFERHSGSHQDATNHMSHGARHLKGAQASNGWIGKAKDHFGMDAFSVIGFGTGNRMDLRAKHPSMVLGNSLASFGRLHLSATYGGENNTKFAEEMLRESLALFSDPEGSVPKSVSQGHELVTSAITKVSQINSEVLSRTFPGTTLGGDFANAARFLRWNKKNHPGRNTLLVLNAGGYDTHEKEALTLDSLIKTEGDAIKAFYDDMVAASLINDVAVACISEFSRTLRENSGLGTDHARATNVMVIGGGVNGSGIRSVYGPLATSTDIQRNFIPTAVHYHDFVREILLWWGASQQDIDVIVPEKPPVSNSIGIFA